MSYVGKWVFHSIGTVTDADEMVYLDSQGYLDSPMPHIDENDEEAVADELRDRKNLIGMQIEITEDGRMYMLIPIPDDAPGDELEAAVAEGQIILRGDMMIGGCEAWENREGELWYTTELDSDGWTKGSDGDGFVYFMTMRFVKAG